MCNFIASISMSAIKLGAVFHIIELSAFLVITFIYCMYVVRENSVKQTYGAISFPPMSTRKCHANLGT